MSSQTETNEAAPNAVLLTLKRAATHAHFFSIVALFVILFKFGSYAYHGVGAVVITFILANAIPPVGMLKPDQFKGNAREFTGHRATFVDKDEPKTKKESKSSKKKK